MSKEIADKVHSLVESKFTYIHDDKQYMMSEHWTSHAKEVLNGDDFKDDCDGFANTCAELLITEYACFIGIITKSSLLENISLISL